MGLASVPASSKLPMSNSNNRFTMELLFGVEWKVQP